MRRKYPEREDARYLELRTMGKTIETIAWLCEVSTRTVRKGIAAAKKRMKKAAEIPTKVPGPHEPGLVPLFPIGAFTRGSKCPHDGPIRPGSLFCCMVCAASGVDDHPALRRSPATDPTPIVKPPDEQPLPGVIAAKEAARTWVDPNAKPKSKPESSPTRKERRAPTAA